MSGFEVVTEDVPDFTRRIGDATVQGSNNALVYCGTDRAKAVGPATVDDGLGSPSSDKQGKGAGTVAAIVGRHDTNGDPDIRGDSATVYVSMRTAADKNLGSTWEGDSGVASAVIGRGDLVRLVSRTDVKIGTDDGVYITVSKGGNVVVKGATNVVVDSAKINLGRNSQLGAVLVDQLVTRLNALENLVNALASAHDSHQHNMPILLDSLGAPVTSVPGPFVPVDPPLSPSGVNATLSTVTPLSSKRTFVDAG